MGVDLGSKVRIVVNQTLLGQQVQNVLHYVVTATAVDDTYAELAQGWWDDIKAAWRAAVTIPLVTDSVEAYDNADPLGDYGIYTIPTAERPGLNGSDVESPFIAAGFRFGVANRTTKPGYMRLSGVRDGEVDAAGVINATLLTKYTTLATALLNGFNYGLLLAGHADLAVYGAPHPASTRYPARDVAVYNDVTAITIPSNVTTQNTRKIGRGA